MSPGPTSQGEGLLLAKRAGKALVGAALLAAGLFVAVGAPRAQDGMGGSALSGARGAAVVEARRVLVEQRRQMARAEAHARMPNTMYASTPSPPGAIPSWHPVLVGPDTEGAGPGPASSLSVSPRTAAGGTHLIPLFASASDPLGRQGFARIINHSNEAGEVRIDAFDDQGDQRGPVTLHIGARRTVHFNSDDLEEGNPAKGLEGATGSGEGHWRLLLTSELDLEVFAYMRTGDGFLTSLHDRVPQSESGYRVVIFNPGSNAN